MVPVWGYASATNTLVSSAIGEGRSAEVLYITWKITLLSVLSVAFLVLLNLIAPAWVLGIYTSDTQLIDDALPVLYIISGSALFIASGFIFFNAVSGTGKTQISLSLEIVALSLYLIYSYSVLQFENITVAGIWTAEYVYGSLLLLLSFFYLKSKRWTSTVV
jgi:Na+-driven multidrug efflux pump